MRSGYLPDRFATKDPASVVKGTMVAHRFVVLGERCDPTTPVMSAR